MLVMGLSLLLARRELSISLVFPTVFFLTALLQSILVFDKFQGRCGYLYYFYYYSNYYGNIINNLMK